MEQKKEIYKLITKKFRLINEYLDELMYILDYFKYYNLDQKGKNVTNKLDPITINIVYPNGIPPMKKSWYRRICVKCENTF